MLSSVSELAAMSKRGGSSSPPADVNRVPGPKTESTTLLPLSEVEKRHILRVYEAMKRNKSLTARVLEVDVKTLYNKLRSYGVHP